VIIWCIRGEIKLLTESEYFGKRKEKKCPGHVSLIRGEGERDGEENSFD